MDLAAMGKKSAQYLKHQCHSNEGLINIDPTRSLAVLNRIGVQTAERAKFADLREEASTVVMKNLPKGDPARKDMAQRLRQQKKLAHTEAAKQPDEFTTEQKIRAAFLNDNGEYSKARIGVGIAGAYMGANLIGHGSLGIPFISTASWNR